MGLRDELKLFNEKEYGVHFKRIGSRAVVGKIRAEGGSMPELSAVFYGTQHIRQPSAGVLGSSGATIHVM